MSTHHDLLIIGSGSGNSLLTPELAHLNIAIAEHGTFGGTCLNVGCIPTKMLVYPAEVIARSREVARLGVDIPQPQVHWRQIRDRVFGRIDPISSGGRDYRAGDPHVTLYEATARMTGERTFDIAGQTVTADRVVIAAGSRPVMLDVPGLDELNPAAGVHTSDSIMRVDDVPARLAIIGSGFIASEMAHVFGSYGSAVTMLVRGDTLISHHEAEVRQRFTECAAEHYDLRLGTTVTAASRVGEVWQLTLSSGDVLEADAVLVAIGRQSNADLLGLPAGGVELDDAGHVVVDEYQQTTAPGVFALGDIANDLQLKHVANHEARVVAHNLANPSSMVKRDHRFVPHVVFGNPQVASFGPTRAQLEAAGTPFVSKTQNLGDVAYGWAMEDTEGFLTVHASPEGQILAAHAIGHEAAMLLQPLVMAASFGISAHDVARGQYWPHPALTEVVENALLGLDVPPGDHI